MCVSFSTYSTYTLFVYMYINNVYVRGSAGTYRVILRIVKAGCHPVAIAQVVEH